MTDIAAASASAVVPGVLGFLIVAGMGVALFFLLRSMNKQLCKVAPGPKWRENGQGQEPGAAATQDSKPNGTSGA